MDRTASLRASIRRFTAAAVVVLYAFLATFGSSLVLCREAGGGVVIEWRGADCCAADPAAPAAGCDETAVADGRSDDFGECGACRDEPVSSLLTSRAAGSVRAPAVPDPADLPAPHLAAEPVVAWFAHDLRPAAVHRAAPVDPPPAASIRPFVLRC